MIAIFDLDGTLANSRHRKGKSDEYAAAHLKHDVLICNVAFTLRQLDRAYGIVIATARSESLRAETAEYLVDHSIPYERLLMKPLGSTLTDAAVKASYMSQYNLADVLCVFENSKECIDMYRGYGLTVFGCKRPKKVKS